MANSSSLYTLLGLGKDASFEEIRRAYHEAARRLHPDVNLAPGATESFLRVQQAFEVLSSPDKRAKYDAEHPADSDELPPVSMNILYSRSTIAKLHEPQVIYVLIEFAALPELAGKSTPPLNVCLVLDRSTSMKGERMDKVKAAAIELVRQMRPEDTLSIITFSDRAEVLLPAGRRPNRSTVETQIHMMQTGGGTEILRGLEAGFFEVRRYATDQRINHMILMTDGQTYGDEAGCLRLAEQAANQGIGISGLGIGEDWNDVFLDNLSSRTGGSSFYIAHSADIQRFLQEKISGLGHVFARQVVMTLSVDEAVQIKDAFRLQPEAMQLPVSHDLRLGHIPSDGTLSVVLELTVDPVGVNAQQVVLATGVVTLEIPSAEIVANQLNLQLSRRTSEFLNTEMPPRPIYEAMSKVTLYRLQEQARQDVIVGQPLLASRRLQYLATQLISQGNRELAQTVLGEAERIQQNQALSCSGEKEIKYGTRALLLPAGIPGGIG